MNTINPNNDDINFQITDWYAQDMDLESQESEENSDDSDENKKYEEDTSEYKIIIFGSCNRVF